MTTDMIPDHRDFLAACYNRMRSLHDRIRAFLARELIEGPVYPCDVLRARLLQEIAELLDLPIRRADGYRVRAGLAPHLTQSRFKLAGLVVDTSSGRVRPTAARFASSLLSFFGLWAYSLAHGFRAMFATGAATGGAVVFGVPAEALFRGDDAAFADFARRGPITAFNQARALIVQALARGAASTDSRIRYARHPLLELLSRSAIDFAGVRRLAGAHLAVAARFTAAVFREPLFALLWRDYGMHAAAADLNARALIDSVVMTNSNMGRQLACLTDLPGRRFDLHFVFYSEHDRPPSYTDVAERCTVNPTLNLLRVHQVWAWTEGRARMLREAGIDAPVHVVGPIQWEMPPADPRVPKPKEWISVFDVSPFNDEAALEYGLLGNYYSARNMIAFIDGIARAADAAGAELPIVMKPKRGPVASKSDPGYLSRFADGGRVRQIPPSSSAWDVIARSAAVVVYPFSTIAHVANALAIPAIYFDPTGKREGLFESGRHIRFVRSEAELTEALRDAVASHAQERPPASNPCAA